MKKEILLLVTIFVFIFQSYGQESATKVKLVQPKEALVIFKNNPNSQLIDVRTKEEFDSGHINNAVNIPVTDADFSKRIDKLNKQKSVYVYCRSGSRSARATKEMVKLGFTHLYDMEGGIISWKNEGFPIKN